MRNFVQVWQKVRHVMCLYACALNEILDTLQLNFNWVMLTIAHIFLHAPRVAVGLPPRITCIAGSSEQLILIQSNTYSKVADVQPLLWI